MDTRQNDLYPDVTAAGGLVSAMKKAAELGMGEIWPVSSPTDDIIGIETTRGTMSVVPATEERLFRVRVHIPGILWDVPGFNWEIGATDDFGLLVEAVVAWREGVPIDELAARFTFLELDEFAGAIERGEPTSSQWDALLSSDFHRRQWNLLRRLHADEVLRHMFPTISHGAVRLCVDLFDGASRQVLVYEPSEESYEVIRPGVPGADWVEVPTGDLIAYLRTALTQE
ncbi:hypothetical protein GCM10022403_024050 [Streptomyces coacervatus]|uniref:DUF2470 domain-containing protein n=1 Tax=Streptomyces coacervatus TaxID=647381 RepID=A0ABP7H9A3_9ACTN|nr:hypothetical protein [Streptomyces coacervatus]MDF2265844.1 hypothetical protein [Streptomyces coacervatus]